MKNQDMDKLIRSGFTVLTCLTEEGQDLRIRFQSPANCNWKNLDRFESLASLKRRLNEELLNPLTICINYP